MIDRKILGTSNKSLLLANGGAIFLSIRHRHLGFFLMESSLAENMTELVEYDIYHIIFITSYSV